MKMLCAEVELVEMELTALWICDLVSNMKFKEQWSSDANLGVVTTRTAHSDTARWG